MSRRVPTRGAPLRAANRLDEIRTAAEKLTELEVELAKARNGLYQLVHDAVRVDKTSPTKIGEAIGVSRQRVYQIDKEVHEKGAA